MSETRQSSGSLDALDDPVPRPQGIRWIMLFYLSALAMLSDWICFCAAPIASFIRRDLDLDDSNLVAIFLATNVAFCLLEPATVRKYGLRVAVAMGAIVMAVGCGLRCLAIEMAVGAWKTQYTSLPRTLAIVGTMLVGAAQPYFQCTPSLLAANWFGENETTLAATVALNANQLGIAGAYAVGAGLIHSDDALRLYFLILFVVGSALAVGTVVHFSERPVHPPSYSAMESFRKEAFETERRRCFAALRKESEVLHQSPRLSRIVSVDADDDDLEDIPPPPPPDGDSPEEGARIVAFRRSASCEVRTKDAAAIKPLPKLIKRWIVTTKRVGHGALDITKDMVTDAKKLAKFQGFDACVIAFVSSIVASNIFSTFLPHLVDVARRPDERQATINARIAGLGAFFQVAIMAGSLGFGAAVDATKAYKGFMMLAFAGSIVSLAIVAWDDSAKHVLEVAVLALGFFVGPIQPCSAELAVDITFPDGDENQIVAIQQTIGNLVSAAAVPVFHWLTEFAHHRDLAAKYDVRFDYLCLGVVTFLSGACFRFWVWRAPLRRLAHNTSAAENTAAAAAVDANMALLAAKSKYMTM